MKKIALTTLLFFCLTFSFGQTKADVVSTTNYPQYFLGIDFSNASFVGDFKQSGYASPETMETIKNKYFVGWNEVLKKEKTKYDIPKAIRKDSVNYLIKPIMEINATTDVDKMPGEKVQRDTKTIQDLIKNYDFTQKEGIGYLFVVDYFDAKKNIAGIHFLAINLTNNEILIDQFMESRPMGFGIRNFWAKTFYNMIKMVEGKYYKKWKKEVAKS